MFTSLRARLWLTYAVIITLILSILGMSIFVYIISNPQIDRQALARLDAAKLLIQRQLNDRSILQRDRQALYERIGESLDIRLIMFDQTREMSLDSQPDQAQIVWPEQNPNLLPKGRIEDQEGKIWLYTSWVLDDGKVLLLATPRQGGLQLLRSPLLRKRSGRTFYPHSSGQVY